jgi:CHAT domain-containing protein
LRTSSQEVRYTVIKAKIIEAEKTLTNFFGNIPQLIAEKEIASEDAVARTDFQRRLATFDMDLQDTTAKNNSRIIRVYSLIGEEDIHFLILSPQSRKAFRISIKRPVLEAKLTAFQKVLANPNSNPLPLAQELYTLLLKPFAAELPTRDKGTVLWYLDSSLRYIPLSALHDGKNYLVETHRFGLFNVLTQFRTKGSYGRDWRIAAFGVTEAKEKFPALPGVQTEINGIVGAKGIFPGKAIFDADFTAKSLRETLEQNPKQTAFSVVHFATHFVYKPNNMEATGMLLGDGSLLTISNLHEMSGLFDGVELVVVSACESYIADEKARDGREIDSFAVTAQNLGAQAVISTLWPVSDTATSVLMREFYRLCKEKPQWSKAECLRQAQVSLRGRIVVPARENAARQPGGEIAIHPVVPQVVGYSHPYYWAAFVLFGNGT